MDLDLNVCIDCALLITNDDLSSLSAEAGQQHREKFAAHQKGEPGYIVVHMDEHESFSWGTCDGCGTTTGGIYIPAVRIID